jgi:heme oxygenase
MSSVVERTIAKRPQLLAKIGDDLATEPFHILMRKGTWRDHRRAETSDFEVALVQGEVTPEAYADLLIQMLPVYQLLEERALELKEHPHIKGLFDERLNRVPLIEADLFHFLGPDWRDSAEILPVTEEYLERIRTASPAQFAAHHYCRYLADLSGGFDIHAGLAKGFGEAVKGLTYYDFTNLGDANEYKGRYRMALSALDLTPDEKLEVIEEVAIAYEFNIDIVAELAIKHGVKPTREAAGAH